MIDGSGIHGFILHYASLFALFLSALLIFIYLWRKKRLDMDEEAKFQLFEDDDR